MMRPVLLASLALVVVALGGCRSRTECASFEDSADRGTRCRAVWQDCADGMTREVNCVGDGRCECRVAGHVRRGFSSPSFCILSDADDIVRLVNRECDWNLKIVGDDLFELP